jgi:hypothetical protein
MTASTWKGEADDTADGGPGSDACYHDVGDTVRFLRRSRLGGPLRSSSPPAGAQMRCLEEGSAGAGWDDTPTLGRVGCPADREIEGKKFSDPS